MNTLERLEGTAKNRRIRVLSMVALAALVVVGSAIAVGSRASVQPTNNSLPTIAGESKAGATLTANRGTWAGSMPMSFQYQWRICGEDGSRCHDIAGATAQTYQLKNDDAGNTARLTVIASNADGSASATSAPTARIAPAPAKPANTSLPTITGESRVDAALRATPGAWSGATPMSFNFQWLICDGNGNGCHDIAGATAQTYTLKREDAGNTLRVRVNATNSGGSTPSTSAPSAKVAVVLQPNGCPRTTASGQPVAIGDLAAPIRLQVDQFQASAGPIRRDMSSFSVRFHVSDICGRAVSGASVYATAVPYRQVTIPAEVRTDSSGWVTLDFRRLEGFPATGRQQRMVMFVRARKAGEPLLAGVSTRRLISLRVNLNR